MSSIKKQKSEFELKINAAFEDSLIDNTNDVVLTSGKALGLFDDNEIDI